MEKEYNRSDYTSDGILQDFYDNNGILWIYEGKGDDGGDNWGGIPNVDINHLGYDRQDI